ncbi:MAG: MSMEG_1061 family FMN-dependent PPOX-type flavoprotein [Methyloligellaceae bacterium]
MKSEHYINSLDELTELMGTPNSKVVEKHADVLDDQCREFISHSPFVLISTSDAKNHQSVSPKGDAPGFIHVLDDKTLLIPERPGNKMAFGFKNILETGRIGLIFMVPRILETLRIEGTARISKDPELLERLSAQNKPALLCTVVKVDLCWIHCGKALIRSGLWNPETWSKETGFSFSRQVANVINVKEDLVDQSIQDDYKNNLY